MKWINPGHEFDIVWKQLNLDKREELSIYIFGAGEVGSELYNFVKKNLYVASFIDNDPLKIKTSFCGLDIISLEKYVPSQNNRIVIATRKEYQSQIAAQLKEKGLKHLENYFFFEEFINFFYLIIEAYTYNRIIIRQAQICVTERCTLKCKECAHGCYAVSSTDSVDLTLDEVKDSADNFFSKIDFVNFFSLLGGEPLIYKNLSEAIRYIGENYRSKIRTFAITTNGTCLPTESVVNACKKYKCSFLISNYTKVIPKLKSKVRNLIKLLEENEIEYKLLDEEIEWIDFGFNYVKNSDQEAEVIFNRCGTDCREIRNNRYYYCVMARSVSDNLHIAECDEFFDMDSYDRDNNLKQLLEFELGYSKKGYLEMCKHCNGMNCNDRRIPAGEQVK